MTGEPFRPSRHGCSFSNGYLVGRAITIAGIPVGRVTEGLCGGMVLVALRDWLAGRPQPGPDRRTIRRVLLAQLRSLDLPRGPWRYLRLQWPTAEASRHITTMERTVPLLRQRLGAGEPVPLGLICALGRTPTTALAHHVVLAYRIRADSGQTTRFAIYDPNHPDDDTITLRTGPDRCTHSRGRPVYAAFHLPVD